MNPENQREYVLQLSGIEVFLRELIDKMLREDHEGIKITGLMRLHEGLVADLDKESNELGR